ncbi:hypothetical protein BHAOGJBA_4429 [Methylobacterium hispanicum]|uniref:Uncharacterized protein n=1 Tax=Methylobacterium hispanicum TaxID=270350 RepID=A0AAV4ZTI8_9HYPH|nr:hypothetical protein [Methylobacterium hispanicum]GJD90885.1 hypothetical protein BHAOGJBA_4429 [Methylobacterium hispanicum]
MTYSSSRIATAIAEVVAGGRFDGFSGNCARFAIALNHALGDVGEFHIVDGGHPEYADHVLLKVGEDYYDAAGASSAEAVGRAWDGPPEYFGEAGEEDSVLRLADDSGCMGAPLDMEALEARLREALGPADAPSAPTL